MSDFACCGQWHAGPPCACRCGHAFDQHIDSIGCIECRGGSCVTYARDPRESKE